jgi:hypothetical protein
MPGEAPPGGYQWGLRPIVVAWSHAGMLYLVGNACLPHHHVDDLAILFLAGSLASTDCQGTCIYDRMAILVGWWG